jgi:hypothetical protein
MLFNQNIDFMDDEIYFYAITD